MLEQAFAGSAPEGAGLDALLERVERGERIVITRAGRVVATLGPPLPGEGGSVDEAIGEILRLRRTRRLGQGVTVRDLIDEGRR